MSRILMVSGLVLLSAMAIPVNAGESGHDGWRFAAVRDETAARSSVAQDGGSCGLVVEGAGSAIADGRWEKQVPLPKSQYLKFSVRHRDEQIEMTSRNVLAYVLWL